MGHGIFEAPAWICAHQRSSMPTLFDVADPSAPKRVWRTTTPNEGHFSASYQRAAIDAIYDYFATANRERCRRHDELKH